MRVVPASAERLIGTPYSTALRRSSHTFFTSVVTSRCWLKEYLSPHTGVRVKFDPWRGRAGQGQGVGAARSVRVTRPCVRAHRYAPQQQWRQRLHDETSALLATTISHRGVEAEGSCFLATIVRKTIKPPSLSYWRRCLAHGAVNVGFNFHSGRGWYLT